MKYQKRIKRFRELKKYTGKVFFLRCANKYSMEPCVFYRIIENVEISEKCALELYEALKNYFPSLDFSLIVVNPHKKEEIEQEKKLLDHIYMIKANPNLPFPVKKNSYIQFFDRLIEKRNTSLL